jgi:hypothetical protein
VKTGDSLTLAVVDGIEWSVYYSHSYKAGHQLQLYVGSDAADWVSPLTLRVREVQGEADVRRKVAAALREVADAIEEGT